MSRQPPGGTSTFSFGNSTESPFKKPEPATPVPKTAEVDVDLTLGGELTAAQKDQIHALVDQTTEAEDLVSKLSSMLASSASNQDDGAEGGHASAVMTSRGFKPATQKVEAAVQNFREALKRRGVDSLARLGKKFRIIDRDNSRKISYEELKRGVTESGCVLTESDLHALFRFLDKDCSGDINIDEFFTGVRGELTTRRMAMVVQAFNVLDVNGDGALTVSDLAGVYDCSRHPDVISGIATEVDVQQNFLAGFDGTMSSTPTKIITPEKFAAYYAGVSASIDDDDYFELMIRNVWHISGGEGWCENTTCRRLLVTHEDGTQTVEEIEDDIFVSKEDLQEMKRRLVEQGVPVAKISLYGDLTGNDPPTTSSPKKMSQQVPHEDEKVVASTYKQRMATSSVTF